MVGSAILMGVLMIGFLAWITPWLNFGMGRMKMDVTISSGEVQGLKRLGELAARDERFATNKHDVDSSANKSGRSYAYAALSERPVLLEGYLHHTQSDSPAFKALLHDNDLIFTTNRRRKPFETSPRPGAFAGLSPVPALTSPCPGHYPHGWFSSKTLATSGSTKSTSPQPGR